MSKFWLYLLEADRWPQATRFILSWPRLPHPLHKDDHLFYRVVVTVKWNNGGKWKKKYWHSEAHKCQTPSCNFPLKTHSFLYYMDTILKQRNRWTVTLKHIGIPNIGELDVIRLLVSSESITSLNPHPEFLWQVTLLGSIAIICSFCIRALKTVLLCPKRELKHPQRCVSFIWRGDSH